MPRKVADGRRQGNIMRLFRRHYRAMLLIGGGLSLMQFTCVSRNQLFDFGRSEFSRIIADVAGQFITFVLTGVFTVTG
jgi:hypothetical protein